MIAGTDAGYPGARARIRSREGETLDTSPETLDRFDATPGEPAQSSSVRGWQLLAEKRAAELAAVRAELDAYRGAEAARQLASEYPDAAELVLRDGGQLSPSMAGELAATQRGIDAARESAGSLIHPNNPRKIAPNAGPPSIQEMERAVGEIRARRMAARDDLGGI
jgi:hypothetical protein